MAIEGKRLFLTLTVTNPSSRTWQFNAALHTYLRVPQLRDAEIEGLQGVRYIDLAGPAAQGVEATESSARLRIDGETDRIYLNVPGRIAVRAPGRSLVSTQSGFADAVIWNPGPDKARLLADLTPASEAHFLCVEAAAVGKPVALGAGEHWIGEQVLEAV